MKLDVERESQALFEEGRARLAPLEANVAASVPCCSDGSRGRVGDARTPLPPLPNRLREDFVPNTVEEAALWM